MALCALPSMVCAQASERLDTWTAAPYVEESSKEGAPCEVVKGSLGHQLIKLTLVERHLSSFLYVGALTRMLNAWTWN